MSNYQNLNVPFNTPIPGGMYAGKMVLVRGFVPAISQRFAVNLLTRSGDIAIHVCPRFQENRVVRNNVHNMNWGPEESHGTLPIYPGQNFEVMILCEQYDFKIAFNGRHFAEFNHRLPFNTISNLAVDGDVVVHNVDYKEQNNYGNNNSSNNVPYGFQPGPPSPNYNSGGLYPSASLHTPNVGYNSNSGGGSYNTNSGGGSYNSNSGGGSYPRNSPYPTQPGFLPHQGPYPQAPNQQSGGYTPTPHTKPGILDQAGMALAGVLGPGLLAGGMNQMNKKTNTHGTGILDQAGRALAGVFGGAGLSGMGKSHKGMMQPHTPTPQARPGILDQAGSALAGILGGGGLAGSGHHNRNKMGGILGGTLGTAMAGAALSGHLNPIKAAKKQKKAQKKALKYGLPIAGAGLGAYALHKGLRGFRRSSSSSSCSSSD